MMCRLDETVITHGVMDQERSIKSMLFRNHVRVIRDATHGRMLFRDNEPLLIEGCTFRAGLEIAVNNVSIIGNWFESE